MNYLPTRFLFRVGPLEGLNFKQNMEAIKVQLDLHRLEFAVVDFLQLNTPIEKGFIVTAEGYTDVRSLVSEIARSYDQKSILEVTGNSEIFSVTLSDDPEEHHIGAWGQGTSVNYQDLNFRIGLGFFHVSVSADAALYS